MTHSDVLDTPVRENVARLKSRLRRNETAMRWLLGRGVKSATVDVLHLGLKEPYEGRDGGLVADPLCFPLVDEAMRPQGRYAYLRIPEVTQGGPELSTWGPGQCATYRLGSAAPDAVAVVAVDVVDCWLAWQERSSADFGVAYLTRTQSSGLPAEWRTSAFWSGFKRVVVLPGVGAVDLLRELAAVAEAPLHLVQLPAPFDALAGSLRRLEGRLSALIDAAPLWLPDVATRVSAVPSEAVGRFSVEPIDITGAHVGGFSYYPFSIETRALEDACSGGRLVQSYETLVLRSDGRILEIRSMPAPRGTDARSRVTALSDGTRIVAAPSIGRRSTWSFGSIERYLGWTRGGERPFRDLVQLVADVERFVRDRVWLPVEDHYLLTALYVMLSHVFQVFDAIPILLVVGPSGSGKSEMAEAIARLGFNASMAGQLRAAAMVRLIDETRGLLVLDDMDGTGAASIVGSGELAQALKMSYKRSTARKPLADRHGRVRIADFYGPKVLTNTIGADHVLGSRLLVVRTQAREASAAGSSRGWSDDELDGLRDELHGWGLADAGRVHAAYRALGTHYRGRREEIVAPLLALGQYVGQGSLADRISGLLSDPRAFWG